MKFWKVIMVSLLAVGLTVFTGCQASNTGKKKEEKKVFVEESKVGKIFKDPDAYKGKYVTVTGLIANSEAKKGGKTLFYVCEDVVNYENYLVVLADNDLFDEFRTNDYVEVTGRIDGGYDDKKEDVEDDSVPLPQITAEKIKMSSYKEVMAPTIREVQVDQTLEDHTEGVKITLQRVELAKNETRVYFTIDNQSEDGYNFDKLKIIQNSKQFTETYNGASEEDPDYKRIEYEIPSGVKEEGMLLFKKIKEEPFKVIFKGWSDNYNFEEDVCEFEVELDPAEEE